MCKQNKVVKLEEKRREETDQSEGCSFTFSQPEDQLLNGKLAFSPLCINKLLSTFISIDENKPFLSPALQTQP